MSPSSGWTSRAIAALDAETTGPDPASDRCVEIALVVIAPGGARLDESYHTLVDPGVPIPRGAVDVHGITDERVRAEGVSPAAALAGILEALRRCSARGMPLVIFNARFDWPLLRAEAGRVGLDVPGLPLIDPLVLDRALDRYRKGKRTLGALARHYGVDPGAAHTAVDDALCAARIAQALAERYPEIATQDPSALQRRQADWFTAWRDDFNGYLRRQGRAAVVSGGWPA